MKDIKQQLKQLNLSDKEVKVYLAVLSIGKGNITDIAKKAGLKRTTLYEYIEELLTKGLIFKTIDKKRVYYSPQAPEQIITMLEQKKADLDQQKENIKEIIPDLEQLYSKAFIKPKISFFEGKQGIREVYWKILDTHQTIYSIFSPDNFFQLFSTKENQALLNLLYNQGGMLKSLVEKTNKPRPELKRKEYTKFIQSKELPQDFKYETDLLVVGVKTALISFQNLIGVIIEDEAIADLQKNLIKSMWNK